MVGNEGQSLLPFGRRGPCSKKVIPVRRLIAPKTEGVRPSEFHKLKTYSSSSLKSLDDEKYLGPVETGSLNYREKT